MRKPAVLEKGRKCVNQAVLEKGRFFTEGAGAFRPLNKSPK